MGIFNTCSVMLVSGLGPASNASHTGCLAGPPVRQESLVLWLTPTHQQRCAFIGQIKHHNLLVPSQVRTRVGNTACSSLAERRQILAERKYSSDEVYKFRWVQNRGPGIVQSKLSGETPNTACVGTAGACLNPCIAGRSCSNRDAILGLGGGGATSIQNLVVCLASHVH